MNRNIHRREILNTGQKLVHLYARHVNHVPLLHRSLFNTERSYAMVSKSGGKKTHPSALSGYSGIQNEAMRTKLGLYSLSTIADPFLPEQFIRNKPITSLNGIRARWQMLVKKVASYSYLFRIKKNQTRQFPLFKFAKTIGLDLFKQVHESIAKNDLSNLRRVCTEYTFSDIKKVCQDKTKWNLESVQEAKIVHAIIVDVAQFKKAFAQITVKFVTTQKIDDEVLPDQVEYMVFERPLFDLSVSRNFYFYCSSFIRFPGVTLVLSTPMLNTISPLFNN